MLPVICYTIALSDRLSGEFDLHINIQLTLLRGGLRRALYDLYIRRSDRINNWERRSAIISTGYFIKKGEIVDTFQIAEILLSDKQDLIHKAVGWMLRAAGDVERPTLLHFLDKYALIMPRTMLRYAIEHLEKPQREHYLKLKKIK
jgi:3-methyladenine DNA glycosylase AlkD